MICQFQISDTVKRANRVIFAAVLSIVITGCGTVSHMEYKYAGYKVVDKESNSETVRVPIRVISCVAPDNRVICERRYGATTECTVTCDTTKNKWIERPEGYGGYEDQVLSEYFLTLESPSGVVERLPVSSIQYEGFVVGQTIGTTSP